MALSDLAVYNEYVYTTMTEVQRQQIDLFNAASRGAILLRSANHQGDYSDEVFFAKIQGLVRRRNAYGSGAVAAKTLQQLVDTMVKVAAGTPPVRLDPGQYRWIQMNPEVAGAALGQQLAGDSMADMLNTALMACRAAMLGTTEIVYDGTGDTPDTISPAMLLKGTRKFGDRSAEIVCWVMHSTPMNDFYAGNIANAASLFTYGTINVNSDPFGRVFIVSDSPALVTAGSPDIFYSLGLTPAAIIIDQNGDFDANIETSNGDENIMRSWQAEWSYNIGIKGYSWDKTNGGHSPNDAALAVSTNWDKVVTDKKDLAGVLVKSN